MPKYTEESIKRAMVELTCQGLEGHRAASYVPMPVDDSYFTGFKCVKCKKVVEVLTACLDLELPTPWYPVKAPSGEETEDVDWKQWMNDPKPTPPYP